MGYFKKFYTQEGVMGLKSPETVDTTPTFSVDSHIIFTNGANAVECVYVQAGAAGISAGTPCIMKQGVVSPAPSTANQGLAIGIAAAGIPNGSYGWVVVYGVVPALFNATVAAGAQPYIAAAGLLNTSAVTGKMVTNLTTTEAVTIASGSALVKCSAQHPATTAASA